VPGVEGFCMLLVPFPHLEVSNERVDVPGFLEHTRSCMLPCMTAVEQAFIKCSTGVMSIMFYCHGGLRTLSCMQLLIHWQKRCALSSSICCSHHPSLRKIVSLGRAKNNVKTKHWVCLFRFRILSISSSGSTFLVCNAIPCL
jgi:hypothetical protein